MPPETEDCRRRRQDQEVFVAFASSSVDDSSLSDPSSTARNGAKVCRLNELESTEVCIDGVIYSLVGFDHPGGDSIHIFGGNDVSVLYKMIHPTHSSSSSTVHLRRLRCVGKVSDYVPEYKFGTPFERDMKREVFKIVRPGCEFGTTGWYMRAFFYLGLLFVLQALWLLRKPEAAAESSAWLVSVAYGVAQALIGLNVQHDANHGACSKKHVWINQVLGFGADLIGGDKWLWTEQHWTHHAYTNHAQKDPDATAGEPFLLFNDYPEGDARRKWIHRFQILFLWPILTFYWCSIVFDVQIFGLQHRGALKAGIRMENDYLKRSRKYAVCLRLLYICVNIIFPFWKQGPNLTTFAHVMVMGASGSLVLASLFMLSHNFETANRDPTATFRQSGQPVCWFRTQVETSCTYGGTLAGWLTGGLNFQVEHHLFPRMSSAWYPYIAPTVRDVCRRHGVYYAYYPSVWQNLLSALQHLHRVGGKRGHGEDDISSKSQ